MNSESPQRQLGLRLAKLREQRGYTQVQLAQQLGVSASYLNQIERNKRPLTPAVQQRLRAVLGELGDLFDAGGPAALQEALGQTLRDLGLADVSANELRALAGNLPQVSQALLDLHRRHLALREHAAALEFQLGEPGAGMSLPAGDQVRDFFNRMHNHIPELDALAERLFAEWGLTVGHMAPRLRQLLADRHGVMVEVAPLQAGREKRVMDSQARTLWLPDYLEPGQQAFQMAAELALRGHAEHVDAVIERAGFRDDERIAQARIGLSNYFAGALVMPYGPFLRAAESSGYDIELLAHQFGVGFEAVCHRLSTLARRSAPGLPFFFIRVDRAGNVSKRHSATDFHFSQVGGSCPLWIVYEAFNQPGRILTQTARMPDGRRHFWLARQVSSGPVGHGQPRKTFAVALGCDLQHAERLVYTRGLDIQSPGNSVSIGPGCRVCPREDCMQRAFVQLPGR
ncbi:helix-turn-helix domain-containing protein [Stenotrophomonas sp. CFBP8980]|uniref:helix-turn-helix domain-containing protein n=1 Tax=Stenotrophomonas sp. CFBP8980 TaxID=3096523 RepID=UPI002A6A40BD|nr:short-chain fatty acyl-CoA regulator family protein [Stenotrophomonas sp. CFBP8980]MDY1035113.1 short-chain fatty acyl-CoA regulator family protein [Stenotrophomonas sp. CFBP8980]